MLSARVLVLDSDANAGAAAVLALTAGGQTVVGHHLRPEAALAALTEAGVDVVAIDPMPWAPALIGELRRACPAARVLAASPRPTLAHVLECFDAGAAGYVTKTATHRHLARHVREAARGLTPLSAEVGTLLLPLLRERRGPRPAPTALTRRERQVLGLLAHGRVSVKPAERLARARLRASRQLPTLRASRSPLPAYSTSADQISAKPTARSGLNGSR